MGYLNTSTSFEIPNDFIRLDGEMLIFLID